VVSCLSVLLSAKCGKQSQRLPGGCELTLLEKEGIKERNSRPGRMDMAQKSPNRLAPVCGDVVVQLGRGGGGAL